MVESYNKQPHHFNTNLPNRFLQLLLLSLFSVSCALLWRYLIRGWLWTFHGGYTGDLALEGMGSSRDS